MLINYKSRNEIRLETQKRGRSSAATFCLNYIFFKQKCRRLQIQTHQKAERTAVKRFSNDLGCIHITLLEQLTAAA